MNVIGIVSSPRKNGNTETLVQAILDGARSAGHGTAKFNLSELDFSDCMACNYCRTNDHCKVNDDATKVLEAIGGADAVVFSTPIYFYQLSGRMRLLEDRMWSLVAPGYQPRLKPGKKAIIVTSQGNPDPAAFDATTEEFAKVLAMMGFSVVDTIKMSNANSPAAIKERKDLVERARNVGSSL